MKTYFESARWHNDIPAGLLMLLPPILGFTYIFFGIIHTGGLRAVIYDLSWLSFAFFFVAFANFSKVSMVDVGRSLPRRDLVVISVFTIVWLYTTTFVAVNPIMAYYTSGRGLAVILTSLAAAALKEHLGSRFGVGIAWALFAGMVLHAPFIVWVNILEGQNQEFEWLWSLPGYPGLRLYNHAVEASIAAGVGLFCITKPNNTLRRTLLVTGTILLWALLFWGGARGAFLSLLATFILMAAFLPQFLVKTWRFFLSTVFLGACLSFFSPAPTPSFGIEGMIFRTGARETLNAASSGRMELWLDAIEIFLQRPLLGHGLAQYQHLTDKLTSSTPEYVHSILLEALISFGLIGTFALIYLLGKILLQAAIRMRTAQLYSEVPMFFVASSLLAHGFVSGTYFHMHSMIAIGLALGLLLQGQTKKP